MATHVARQLHEGPTASQPRMEHCVGSSVGGNHVVSCGTVAAAEVVVSTTDVEVGVEVDTVGGVAAAVAEVEVDEVVLHRGA